MKTQIVKLTFSLALLLAGLSLVRCGQPYCIAGLGQCSKYASTTTGSATTGAGGSLYINVSPLQNYLPVGTSYTFTVTGGTPTYTLSLTSPGASGTVTCSNCLSTTTLASSSVSATLTAVSSGFGCPSGLKADSTQIHHYCSVLLQVTDLNQGYGSFGPFWYYVD